MQSFTLRTATLEDAPGIQSLIEASVRGLQTEDYSEAQREGALATLFSVDLQLIGDETYFVATAEDGELAGCGGWSYTKPSFEEEHPVKKFGVQLPEVKLTAAKIRSIFVHPKFARNRVGSLILKAAEDAAKTEGFRRLEMASTLTGVALFGLRGYRKTDRINVPVGRRERFAIVHMLKEL